MKKLLLSILGLILGLAASADELAFQGPLTVTVNGQPVTQTATIQLSAPSNDEGEIVPVTFTLPNFTLAQGGTTMFVGNIVLPDVPITSTKKLSKDETEINFAFKKSITIQPGTCPAEAQWVGQMLGEVPVDFKCKIIDKEEVSFSDITATFHIDIEMGALGTVKVDFQSEKYMFAKTDDLSVTVNGQTATQKTTVFFTDDSMPVPGDPEEMEELISLTVPNFTLTQGGQTMYVGNIELANVPVHNVAGHKGMVEFSYNGNINIKEGQAAGVEQWIGPMLGPVPAVLKGYVYDYLNGLVFNIDIEMTSLKQTINVRFGDYEKVGIASPVAGKPSPAAGIYNLAGQPAQALKGIVISGGKKKLY